MAHDSAIYTQILQALLPQGRIWPRDPEAVLTKLLQSWAEELARVDGRADDLLDEVNPDTTFEMLSDFERVCGLPDKCVYGEETFDQRRAAVLAKLTSRGGQTPAYFIALAAQLGYAVEIEEFQPFRVGSGAGERAYGTDWAYAWRVIAPLETIEIFRAGSCAGERLATWGNDKLECYVGDKSPAHTALLFGYYAHLATEDDELLTTEDGEDLYV